MHPVCSSTPRGGERRKTLIATRALLLGVFLAVTACAAEQPPPQPPPVLPGDALAELDSRRRSLDDEALAADAIDSELLLRLLEDGGYVVGSEREFYGRTATLNHVVARVLIFEDPEGAGAYLDWLGTHASDLIGQSQREEPLAIQPSLFFSLRTSCCPKVTPTFLVAWQREATIFSLLASGPGADRRSITAIAGVLDDVV